MPGRNFCGSKVTRTKEFVNRSEEVVWRGREEVLLSQKSFLLCCSASYAASCGQWGVTLFRVAPEEGVGSQSGGVK